ncbi:PHD transcription factor [Xylona heveae TC161]|uniref:PHD transcription factor n=1 Tax=Xylona heveae (strain CBS 132557 / TC161) TaxID=1328760 RepID=A0A165ADZ6_XYLHT|nr:PHD transcription factor [Xylona heveae TC161]KZF20320.1 PHD transcription factor [Xylona heveae TC161]
MVVPPSTGGSTTAGTATRSTNTPNGTSRPKSSNAPNGQHAAPNNASVPLSARKSQPLDMSTVERKVLSSMSRETPKRSRPMGIQEAPTYRPTSEEFKDPMEYIRKIVPEGMKYGIVKVVPPDDWNPEFAIDTERFHFRTRKQELNSVEGGTRANLNYLDQLAKFHKQHGNNLNRFPSVDKRPLDLYKLKKAVEVRGGFDKVCKLKKWAEIGRDLGYSGKIMSSLSTSLKNSYQKWLHPYEEYLRIAKPGVQQQLEMEYGGPLTPSPATSPMKKTNQASPSRPKENSPAMRATAALYNRLKEPDDGEKSSSENDAPPPPFRSSGFTAVNTGGFTPVNATNGIKREPEIEATPPTRSKATPTSSAKNTPDCRSSALSATPVTNGHSSNRLKRQLGEDSPDRDSPSDQANGDSDKQGRRSKRLKKESTAPTVAGSYMTFRPSTPRVPGEMNGKPGEKCETCGKGEDPKSILLCDSCDVGYHKYCLDPPLKAVPDYDWHCPRCLVGTGEFGFEDGGIYSLKQFQEKANNFKENYFLPKMPFDPVLNSKRPVTEDDVEREFWRLVENLTETVEVEYGADIHSTTHGSGFPTIEKNPLDPYSTDPWNLNILPLHPESLFRHIKSDISGMTVPWLYVGMCFSTFCWHNEDHFAYSANYQHIGATKTWYGIPGEDAEKFEDAMREAVPELFETQPDLLFQLVTLLPPDRLQKAGVRVYALDQRAGQFVLTFPKAYHAGFNHGFNVNEAVNFAPNDWEPDGEAGVERLQAFRRQPCFSHDELLLTAAARDTTIKTSKWLAPALERMRDRELDQRQEFLRKHKEPNDHYCKVDEPGVDSGPRCDLGFEMDDQDVPEEEYQCCYCKAFSYLSRFQCTKTSKTLCLLHAGQYACCEASEEDRLTGPHHTLRYRMTDEALESLVQKVVDRARVPEAWAEKLARTLDDDPRPSLKVLRSLLSEGERIPFELPQLPTLKAFVERCNDWVEEATNYITRKQQNRRKNEKAWRKGNSSRAAEMEERDKELRKIENVHKLLASADDISFDCPEITTLRERAEAINDFQRDAQNALLDPRLRTTQEFEELAEMGKGFNVDIPEVEKLDKVVQQMKWNDRAQELRVHFQTLQEVEDFIQKGIDLAIPEHNEHLIFFKDQKQAGELWEAKAKELISVEVVHYQQLEALSGQASSIPVTRETLAAVDGILTKQREAHKQIVSLYERSKDPIFRKRPTYKAVRDVMESLAELNSKPTGTIDLEKEQKRHEDWMRKGKKLFGKANAPLHILKSHMELVASQNEACFSLSDRPRTPVEPSSREHTPDDSQSVDGSGSSKDVFCICRKPEAGMMIECELCHEWYHGKCLKIARGKVKEDDKYTCPICDWRVKIPRDAARPKLEDLQDWQAEIPNLPFQPDEEDILESIINAAQEFRDFMRPLINPMMTTPEEVMTQRFYLRKIEGADILLAYETNFFRQELHKWAPVAPEPPPILEQSLSTRKPRPTKQQKLMAQLGIENPEDLPQHLRTKQHNFNKRKSSEPHVKQPPPLQPAPGRPTTPLGLRHSASSGNPPHPSLVGQPPPADQHGPQFTYDGHFSMSGPPPDQPAFAPSTSFMPGHPPELDSPNFSSSMRSGSVLDPAIFSGPGFGRGDQVGSPLSNHYGSSQGANLDSIFADLTNQDADGIGSSHANEALAVSGADDDRTDEDADQEDQMLADEFLN